MIRILRKLHNGLINIVFPNVSGSFKDEKFVSFVWKRILILFGCLSLEDIGISFTLCLLFLLVMIFDEYDQFFNTTLKILNKKLDQLTDLIKKRLTNN